MIDRDVLDFRILSQRRNLAAWNGICSAANEVETAAKTATAIRHFAVMSLARVSPVLNYDIDVLCSHGQQVRRCLFTESATRYGNRCAHHGYNGGQFCDSDTVPRSHARENAG